MPSFDFSVYCDRCGAGLCRVTRVSGTDISVEPCQSCMQVAEEEAYEKGFDAGVSSVE